MEEDAEKDPAAQSMARKRWENTSPRKRKEYAKKAAAKRWEGHEAKRPASARKKKMRREI